MQDRSRIARAAPVLLGLALSATGYALAERVVPRLSDHRGFYLVTNDDRVTVPIAAHPRRALVIIVDGLRQDAARSMRAVARVRAQGRCAVTSVGLPSVSRPVYAELSSGVEQERTGVRNNDDASPARVDSIWSRARAAGMRVAYRSELAWWGELFPRGFDAATVRGAEDDLFAAPLDADLTLVHPVYVDDASHDHGARSDTTRAAVARADRELSSALDRVDFAQDLVVITADHGHRDRGGHGGPAPEVTEVLTCFGGRGVRRAGSEIRADARDLAPTLAVLLGVALPRHAATRRDPSALVAATVDPEAVGRAYLDARLEGIARARARGRAALHAITGDAGATWDSVRAWERARQLRRGLLAGAPMLLALALLLRRTLARGDRLRALAWCAALAAAHLAAYRALSGGLDASSLNRRWFFTRNVLVAACASWALGVLAHRALGGTRDALTARAGLLLALSVAANVAHIAAYGWPLGYPLPGPYLYFAPFLMTTFQLTAGLAFAALSYAAGAWRSRG